MINRNFYDSNGRPRIRVLDGSNEPEWRDVVKRVEQHDFYFLPGYHALAERRGEGKARLFVFEQDQYLVALPFLLRPLADSLDLEGAAGLFDATSIYGYAGPVVSHSGMPQEVVSAFQSALTQTLEELHVVSLFSRLHPLIPQQWLLEGLGKCLPGGQTVSIDLALPMDAQRTQYCGSAKTRLNRLRRSGVVCFIDGGKQQLGDFVDVYHETMRRVGAHDAYFFDRKYFDGLNECLGDALRLFVVKDTAGVLIGGGLFTLCDGVVEYHLGGTRDAFLHLSPMGLVLDTVRLWANEQGARIFHLGGGVGAKPDSLFQFKAGFSDVRHEFATWRWILNPQAYEELGNQRASANRRNGSQAASPNYFPSYRSPAIPTPVVSQGQQTEEVCLET